MPSPAENANTVMKIYAHFKGREGHVLLPNNFVSVAARHRIPISDIQSGINHASENQWIIRDSNGFWKLTKQGADEVQAAGS